jgi:hypothetical protein
MTDEQIRAIKLACEELSITYARAIDFRDYDYFITLFTEDAVLDTGKPRQGRAAIAESLTRRPDELRSRHVISNVFIDVLNENEARGISYLTLYRHVGEESLKGEPIHFDGPAGVGHYEDRFEKTAEGWKFKRRKLHFAFRRRR